MPEGQVTGQDHIDGRRNLLCAACGRVCLLGSRDYRTDVSIKAGQKIYARLVELCDGEISPGRIAAFSDDEARSIGTSKSKVSYIRNITNAIIEGELELDDLAQKSDADVMSVLTKIRGIGNWTAKMYLIFVLNRPDVLPTEDVAFLQGYRWAYKTDDCSRTSVEQK